jgi:hypothetical protein
MSNPIWLLIPVLALGVGLILIGSLLQAVLARLARLERSVHGQPPAPPL